MKLRKIIKDVAHLYEQFDGNLPDNYPLSRYSYLVLNPVEYVNSILSQEDVHRKKEDEHRKKQDAHRKQEDERRNSVQRSQNVVNVEGAKKIESFVWNKSAESDVLKLLQKHAFDFEQVHAEFVKTHPECEYTIKELQQQWTQTEMQRYRALQNKKAVNKPA